MVASNGFVGLRCYSASLAILRRLSLGNLNALFYQSGEWAAVAKAPVLGADQSFASGISASRAALLRRSRRFLADSWQRAEHGPADSLPLRVVLPGFAFDLVAGGVSRGISGRCARFGPVVRFLQRAVLCEVARMALIAVGSSVLATIRSVPPQWPHVLNPRWSMGQPRGGFMI